MRSNSADIKKRLVRFGRKIAEDKLAIATSGNISLRKGSAMYIKKSGASFDAIKASDFMPLNIRTWSIDRLKGRPSCEYQLHASCYNKRPEIEAVFHTHPLISTLFHSAGIKQNPLTMEFCLYIGKRITSVGYLSPGTKLLANAIARAVETHDCVIIKKHGLVTVGNSLQEAYLKSIIVEREYKARLICKLLRKRPPCLKREEIADLTVL